MSSSMKKIVVTFIAAIVAIPAFSQFTAQFDFTYSTEGEYPVTGKGTAVLQDSCYHAEVSGFDIWCDGETRWIIDTESKEVIVEVAEPLLDLIQNLDLKHQGNDVVGATFNLDDGTPVKLDIKNFKQTDPVNQLFKYDTSRLGDEYVITDLR